MAQGRNASPRATVAPASSPCATGPPSPLSQSSNPVTPRRQAAPISRRPLPGSAPSALPDEHLDRGGTQRKKMKMEHILNNKTTPTKKTQEATSQPAAAFFPGPSPANSHSAPVLSAAEPLTSSEGTHPAAKTTPGPSERHRSPQRPPVARSQSSGQEDKGEPSPAAPPISRCTTMGPPSATPASRVSRSPSNARGSRDETLSVPPAAISSSSSAAAAAVMAAAAQTSRAGSTQQDVDGTNGMAMEVRPSGQTAAEAIDVDLDSGNCTPNGSQEETAPQAASEDPQPAPLVGRIKVQLMDGQVSLPRQLFKTLPADFQSCFDAIEPEEGSTTQDKHDELFLSESKETFLTLLDWYRHRVLPPTQHQRLTLQSRATKLGLNLLVNTIKQAPRWQGASTTSPEEFEKLDQRLWQRMLDCDDLEMFRWAGGHQSGLDLLASFRDTVRAVVRHLQNGRSGPCKVNWRTKWGERSLWPFWYHVQGPDEGRSSWTLEQDARPSLARAIFLEGDVKAMSHGQDDELEDGEEDEDAGEGITLRVADLVDALGDRLLQVGVRLEKLTFGFAEEELWIQASPFKPIPA